MLHFFPAEYFFTPVWRTGREGQGYARLRPLRSWVQAKANGSFCRHAAYIAIRNRTKTAPSFKMSIKVRHLLSRAPFAASMYAARRLQKTLEV
jgi:hypothetical protein